MTSHHDVAGVVTRLRAVDYFSDNLMASRSEADADLIDRLRAERKEAADLLESQAKALSEAETAILRTVAVSNGHAARALAAEARLAEAMKALAAIAEHPKSYNDGKRSYAVGWAFWNVQNIARAFTNAAKEKTDAS